MKTLIVLAAICVAVVGGIEIGWMYGHSTGQTSLANVQQPVPQGRILHTDGGGM